MNATLTRPKARKWTWEDYLAAPLIALAIFGIVMSLFFAVIGVAVSVVS